ncbi:uncharacterized protein LOC123559128 [Mercenaria mercenaria]|uniref:uncharacterized protein LOC123559128 n=1 Tax=Mercenaria mercenaria TaxID=6596 RepID=UPI00234EC6D1|nr:uncharacterized protein LOC123559128 [Mercenaria mercenaria]
MKCPYTHLYIKQYQIDVKYWNFSFYRDRYIKTTEYCHVKECVQNCSKFKSGNSCVEKCPSSRSYLNGDRCLSFCPDDTFADLRDKKCVENCPNDTIKQGHTCRIICGNNLLYKDGECVHDYECEEKSFEFAGQCLHNCPDGFVWFVSCVNVLAVGLCIPVLFIPTIGLIILGRHIFIDLLTIIRLTFFKEDQLTEYLTKKHMQRPIKAATQTPRKEEEVLLLEDMDSSDEELLLFTRTRCRIIDGDVETVL